MSPDAPSGDPVALSPETEKLIDWFMDDGSPSGPDEYRMVSRNMVRMLITRVRSAAEATIVRLTQERDQAIAHDRQPYPTAAAYEIVCAALQKHKDTLADLHTAIRQVQQEMSEAVSWHDGPGPPDPRLVTWADRLASLVPKS